MKTLIPVFVLVLSVSCVVPKAPDSKVLSQAMPSVHDRLLQDYDTVLSRAPHFFERGWTEGYQGDPSLGFFAEGGHGELSMRTLGNFITTYAFLARHPGYDEELGGVSRAELERKALAAIRYMIRTNTTGDLVCTTGFKWGDDPLGRDGWESSWYASKMTTGAVMIWDALNEADKEGIRKVLASESDRSARVPPPTGTRSDTKSEENAWDCESLAWALVLFPDDVRAATWEHTLYDYAMNTLSVPQDADDHSVVGDKTVSQWFRGPNVHPDFTIENHGFFHICYQICPLHSLAWSVYAYVQAGKEPPPCLFHHFEDVWRELRKYYLWDGRFAYVGGKDWPRYVYGMNFIFPALALVQNVYADDCASAIERKRLDLLKWEQEYHGDGSFFSGRFTNLDMFGRHVEYESDVYADMILAYRLHQIDWPESLRMPKQFDPPLGTTFSQHSNHILVRGERRFASWSWNPRVKPAQGIFAIRGMESALEWDGNLFGRTYCDGFVPEAEIVHTHTVPIPGGFATAGLVREGLTRDNIRLIDDVSVGFIPVLTDHPLLNKPHRIGTVDRLVSHDSIERISENWSVIAKSQEGRPCLVSRKVGKGEIVVCMANAGQLYLEESDPCLLFENLVHYFAGSRVGYLLGEETGEQALAKAGISFDTITDLGKVKLKDYDWILAGRNSFDRVRYKAHVQEFREYLFNGGGLITLVLQDNGFDSRWLTFGETSAEPEHAVDHSLAFIALPDDMTCLRYDFLRANISVRARLEGLRWLIGNDIFNGNKRTINGEEMVGVGGSDRVVLLNYPKVNVDDRLFLTVLQGEGYPAVRDAAQRNVIWKSLLVEAICYPWWETPGEFAQGQVIQRTVVSLDGR
ncbi:MAG TPA: hypothetical protein PKH07_02415, partial [bacterium]|nr:hypothetical protein [bacterium]